MLYTLAKILAPYDCLSCNARGSLMCDTCLEALHAPVSVCYRCNKLSPEYRTCSSCRSSTKIFACIPSLAYEGLAKKLVAVTKFSSAKEGCVIQAWLIKNRLSSVVKDVDVVTYVPTVNARVRQRGFDHAKVVAAFVAQHINRPHETLLLRKGNNRQVGATRQTRRAQVAGTLTVVNVTKPKGKRILIVDDVISTGATLEEAAKTLKAAGAKRVYVTVLATNR